MPKLLNKHVVILIPAGRPAPIMTLESYQTKEFKVVLVSDPAHFNGHQQWIKAKKLTNVTAVKGKRGIIQQVIYMYQLAHQMKYKWAYRLDDDLRPNSFVTKTGFSNIDEVGIQMLDAANQLQVSLVGPASSCNRLWLGEEAKRSATHVTGGCQLFKAHPDPVKYGYISDKLHEAEDIFRTLAHRKECGAIGKLTHIGFDKRKSCGGPESLLKDREDSLKVESDAKLILSSFPDMIKCTGRKETLCGPMLTWRHVGRPTKLTGEE